MWWKDAHYTLHGWTFYEGSVGGNIAGGIYIIFAPIFVIAWTIYKYKTNGNTWAPNPNKVSRNRKKRWQHNWAEGQGDDLDALVQQEMRDARPEMFEDEDEADDKSSVSDREWKDMTKERNPFGKKESDSDSENDSEVESESSIYPDDGSSRVSWESRSSYDGTMSREPSCDSRYSCEGSEPDHEEGEGSSKKPELEEPMPRQEPLVEHGHSDLGREIDTEKGEGPSTLSVEDQKAKMREDYWRGYIVTYCPGDDDPEEERASKSFQVEQPTASEAMSRSRHPHDTDAPIVV